MKYVVLACCIALAPGCALFRADRSASAEAVIAPAPLAQAPAAAPQMRAPFRPAFAAGRPVALVPCRGSIAVSADCATRNERHQVGGETPAE